MKRRAFFDMSREEQLAELERGWRGNPAFIGPVGPPMLIAMRQPGYVERLMRRHWPPVPVPAPVAIGYQFSLALDSA